jgi:hypothetical protein
MGVAGQVACAEEMKNAFKILLRKSEGKNHLKDLTIEEKRL